MNYSTSFYYPCPVAGQEVLVEVFLFRDEAPADYLEYWGTQLPLPATNEVHITAVFRDGKIWEDYPDTIEKEIYSYEWTRIDIRDKRA